MKAADRAPDRELERLRNAHRTERAPEALRQRVLRRASDARAQSKRTRARSERWLSTSGLLGLAAVVCGGLWLAGEWLVSAGSSRSAPAGFDLVPTAEPASASAACPKPLPSSPWNPSATDLNVKHTGFEPQLLDVATRGCGPLRRRYLLRVPPGAAASAPILLVLHDAGESAELVQLATRWWFDDLAQRERAVLVYANGGPSASGAAAGGEHGGVWQTDEQAHPAVDDVAYLDAIVDDLHDSRRIGERGEVFLSGYGSGAQMALVSALQRPERFSGVAAFLSAKAAEASEQVAEARRSLAHGRLRSILIVLSGAAARDASPLTERWVTALGGEPASLRVVRRKPGITRSDTTLAGGIALRILALKEPLDPFPLPGGGDELAWAASAARAAFFDGPGAAWDFFQQGKP